MKITGQTIYQILSFYEKGHKIVYPEKKVQKSVSVTNSSVFCIQDKVLASFGASVYAISLRLCLVNGLLHIKCQCKKLCTLKIACLSQITSKKTHKHIEKKKKYYIYLCNTLR